MIQRRQFLGSMTAFCVAAGANPIGQIASATTPVAPRIPADLHWESVVIETVPHNAAHLAPVVTGVSLQKNGDLLAIVGDDHVVCLFDTQQQIFTQHLRHHTDWVRAASFSPDGKRLASAGNDRKLMVWNVGFWDEPAYVKIQPEAIIDVAFSHDGSRLATVGFDSWLRVYDVATGEKQQTVELTCPDNHAVVFSSDDRLIAAGGRCGSIRVYDSVNFTTVAQYKPHRQRIRTLEFMDDGNIVSAGDDQQVVITNPMNPASQGRLPRLRSKLYATALLDDGLLATAGSDNKIHIWQLSDLQNVGSLSGHTGTVSCLAYQDQHLVSGSYDTHARVWTTQKHTSFQQRQTDLSNGWTPALK